MRIIYVAPNRAHHYRYAIALHKYKILHKFISGFPRFSPRARLDIDSNLVDKVDFWQLIYLFSLKLRLPRWVTQWFALLPKLHLDYHTKKVLNGSNLILFYNGCGLWSLREAKKRGIVTVVEAVNSHVLYQDRLLKEEYRLLNLPWSELNTIELRRRVKEYEEADYILVPSDFVKKSFIEEGICPSKLLKVPYGFQNMTKTVDFKMDTDQSTFRVLYVGALSPRKGIHYLIEAFNRLKVENKKLILVGGVAESAYEKILKKNENIEFLGILKGDDLNEEYKKASVFCLPSIEEGLALVLGEALSFGLPIIATVNTGAGELIRDNEEGFIVPIRNSESVYSKLDLLSKNRLVYETMRRKAFARAKSMDGWEETGKNLVNTLLNLKENKQ